MSISTLLSSQFLLSITLPLPFPSLSISLLACVMLCCNPYSYLQLLGDGTNHGAFTLALVAFGLAAASASLLRLLLFSLALSRSRSSEVFLGLLPLCWSASSGSLSCSE